MPGGKAPRAAGDYFERRTRDALEHAGWLVIRSGGSLGVADLVALKNGHVPLLVSCKKGGYMTRPEVFALCEAAALAGAAPILATGKRPGWADLTEIGKHGRVPFAELHFPPR